MWRKVVGLSTEMVFSTCSGRPSTEAFDSHKDSGATCNRGGTAHEIQGDY